MAPKRPKAKRPAQGHRRPFPFAFAAFTSICLFGGAGARRGHRKPDGECQMTKLAYGDGALGERPIYTVCDNCGRALHHTTYGACPACALRRARLRRAMVAVAGAVALAGGVIGLGAWGGDWVLTGLRGMAVLASSLAVLFVACMDVVHALACRFRLRVAVVVAAEVVVRSRVAVVAVSWLAAVLLFGSGCVVAALGVGVSSKAVRLLATLGMVTRLRS